MSSTSNGSRYSMIERTRFYTRLLFAICTGFLICESLLLGEIYFKDTDRQMEVIRIKGEQPGLTVLILGGIHGDEPGGYFSSEKLSGVKMIKGNLVIVPRVNFPSIMLYRRDLHGDLNRKFGSREKPGDPDADVIQLLKNLMKEADVFINQHDAFGFHRETYISRKYNPNMYGQSLIIDCARFYSEKLQRQFDLAEMGKRIMERVNRQIENKDYYFGFWDHDSLAKNTKFPEMKKSATYYALTTYSIPAFGLETSKDLPSLYLKVKYQLIVIGEILHEFGLEAVFPPPDVDPPVLYWVEFLKNNKDIIRVNENTNLRLKPGDTLVIDKIYSNYDTGLSADIMSWGNINDVKKEFVFKNSTEIQVKKNNIIMGTIHTRDYLKNSVQEIAVEVNGEKKTIPNWGKIELHPGQYFKILKTNPSLPGTRFDVRGFEAAAGHDDSNMTIYAEKLMPRFSFMEKEEIYFVKIYNGKILSGGFQVEIKK
jgi:hypothetical protein